MGDLGDGRTEKDVEGVRLTGMVDGLSGGM